MSNYDLTPADFERLLLGHVLHYGIEAAKLVLPALTHDKFVHSKTGELGGSQDHARIWQAISLCYLSSKMSPDVAAVRAHLEKDYHYYLDTLDSMLSGHYRVYGFDPNKVVWLAEQVDKCGALYAASAISVSLAEASKSPEAFASFAARIEDIDLFLSDHIHQLSSPISVKTKGYQHVGIIGAELKQQMRLWQEGKQLVLLPVGLPTAEEAAMYYVASLFVQHGMSQAGKSAWTHLVQLGTAIGLKNNNVKGCVAVNSLEEDQHGLVLKLAGILSGVSTAKLKFGGGLKIEDYDRLERAVDYVGTLPIFVDNTNLLTTSELEMRLMGLHTSERGPVYMMSVDYIEMLESSDRSDSKEQELNEVVRRCHSYSRNTGACVIVLSQSTFGETGKYKIAGADGTRYSKSLRHAADVMSELWNPVYMKQAMINFEAAPGLNDSQPFQLVQKHKEVGLPEPLALGWEPEFRRFRDPKLADWQLFSHDIPYFGPAKDEGGF